MWNWNLAFLLIIMLCVFLFSVYWNIGASFGATGMCLFVGILVEDRVILNQIRIVNLYRSSCTYMCANCNQRLEAGAE